MYSAFFGVHLRFIGHNRPDYTPVTHEEYAGRQGPVGVGFLAHPLRLPGRAGRPCPTGLPGMAALLLNRIEKLVEARFPSDYGRGRTGQLEEPGTGGCFRNGRQHAEIGLGLDLCKHGP